jgi:drug/metabolite transporter (DMT)-like permease
MRFLGELAAVGTAVCWGCTSSLFTTAGRRMGSAPLNRLRLVAAAVLLGMTLWILRGSPWPSWATTRQISLLAASGLLGFAFGDGFYFRSLVILGPGRAALVMSLSPLFAAVLGWIFLDETLGPHAWTGMVITLAGLAAVLYGRARGDPHPEGSVPVGIVSGVLGALLASAGYILSKLALREGLDALSGTTIRVAAAAPAAWLLALVRGDSRRGLDALRDRVTLRTLLGGAFLGPFLGVSLSLLALQHTEAAVAAAIFSCFPLLAILLGARFHHEPITPRTALGAAVTVGGIMVLFLRR